MVPVAAVSNRASAAYARGVPQPATIGSRAMESAATPNAGSALSAHPREWLTAPGWGGLPANQAHQWRGHS